MTSPFKTGSPSDYRSQIIAQQSRTLFYCLTVAALAHVAAIATLSLPQLFSQSPATAPKKDAVKPAEPIKFVYIEPSKTIPPVTPPKETTQFAQIDAIAGGDRNPDKAVNAGKLVDSTLRQPVMPEDEKVAIADKFSPKGVVASAHSSPKETPTKPSAADTAAETKDKAANSKPAQVSETPPTEPKANSRPEAPRVMTGSTGDLQIAPPQEPFIPPKPSPFPEAAPSPLAGHHTPTRPEPQAGTGLNGSANSNRDAIAAGNVDARRDPIWAPYFAEVNRRMEQPWRSLTDRLTVSKSTFCVVLLQLDAEGQLINAELVESSGVEELDLGAMNVIEASTFPPFPEQVRGSDIKIQPIRQKFEFNLSNAEN